MSVPSPACTNCGKNFTTDELRGTHCRYCGTLLAHHARAQQQVAVMNQMMEDRNGNGIPDAFEGVVANAQANAMNQAFGMGGPAMIYGQAHMGAPPMVSGPQVYVNGVPLVHPGMHPHAAAQISHAATKAASGIMLAVVLSIVGITFVSILVGVLMFMMH